MSQWSCEAQLSMVYWRWICTFVLFRF